MSGLRKFLAHAAGVFIGAALLIGLIAVLAPTTVLAPAEVDFAAEAASEFAVALEEFGMSREGNYCPILMGGTSVRPDRAVLVRVRHAESVIRQSPYVAMVFAEFGNGRLYAWMEMSTGTLYITNHYLALSRQQRLATLFHEVRGHWELRLSDEQMQVVLCPNSDREDTSCITRQIIRGCPTLRGRTTEQVYRLVLTVGPLITAGFD
jgi:hypothetical protein